MVGRALHLNLDDAWRDKPLGLPVVDARSWGPRLRFSAPGRLVAEFYREHETDLASPFLLYGSGDFHYLTALRLRRIAGPFVLVSFDNHPDWDVRPPKWGCGGWVNRALELANIKRVSVWGCGNFECWWPHQIFGNRRAERAGILDVHPWADNRRAKDRERRGAILRDNWRQHFDQFLETAEGENVYVTIDLDCLNPHDAVTNWEAGRFTIADLRMGIRKIVRVVANYWGRCLWCLFASKLRAFQTALRRGIRSPKNPVAGSRPDPPDQSDSLGKIVAVSVGRVNFSRPCILLLAE